MSKRERQTIGAVLGAVLLAASIVGCDDSPPVPTAAAHAATSRPSAPFVAFVGAGDADPIWPVLKSSAERYAQQLGSHEIRYFVPNGNSPQDQVRLVQTLNDPRMGGLCIEVSDRNALQPVLEPIYLRGVILVSMIKPLPPNMRSGHVGFDDAEIGTTLADTTAKVFEERGTVMLLHSGKKNPIYGARLAALEKQLAMYPDIEVFAEVDCQMDAVQARRLMRERSERYPRLSAWISVEDWPLQHFGELDTIMPPACKFITFGGTPAHWPMIRSGRCPAMVAGNYNDLGAKAVQFCEGAMHKTSSFQTVYNAPLRVIWASHLDDYITDWTYWLDITHQTLRQKDDVENKE